MRYLYWLMSAVWLVPMISIGTALVGLHMCGYQLLGVQSASMVPLFAPGDALIVRPVRASTLHVGDIISYRSSADPRVIISHRVTAINLGMNQLTTSGDHLRTSDPPITTGQLVGQVTAVAPKLGSVLTMMRQPAGLLITIYLPACCWLYGEFRRLGRYVQRPVYQLIRH